MSDDLYEVWRDDQLIEAAARGDLLEIADDPAAGPLAALSVLADAAPLPRLDFDSAALVDSHTTQRYAVRSLAVAVTAVATLSTSGVAAVVTGDPLRPAKAVWHQIQDHTGFRSDSADAGAVGPAVDPRDADASRPAEVSVTPRTRPTGGLVVRAPAGEPVQAPGDQATMPADAQSAPAEDPAAESTQPSTDDDAQSSDEQDQSQESTDPAGTEDQQPSDDTSSEPAPGEEQQPPQDGQSDDGGLGDVVPTTPGDIPGDIQGDIQGDGTTQPLPADGTGTEDGAAQDPAQPSVGDTAQDGVQGTLDGAYADGSTAGSTAGSTGG